MMQQMPMMQMMRGMHGMHQQMMQNPMHRAGMMAFALPALADTLGLEDQQVEELDALKSEMTEERQRHREEMQAAQQELQALFEDDETPAPEEVRAQLQEIAELRAEGQAAIYETAQRMREVLTEEQQSRLDELTPQQIHRQMMRNMTMMDMMQMMQSMHGGMMGGGMMQGMQGGMMQQGGRQQHMPQRQNRQNR